MVPVLLTLATLIAVGLMVVVLLRMGKRYETLQAEFDRLKIIQRDMSTDVRTRLDEGTKTWEAVEAEVKPRLTQLEALEPSVADLSSALEENLPALTEARQRLEAVEAKADGTDSRVTAALEAGSSETGERFDRVEEAVRTLRNAADERLADLAGRVSALEEAATAPELEPALAGAEADDEDPIAPPPLPASVSVSSEDDDEGDISPTTTSGESSDAGGRWLLIAVVVAIGVVALLAALDT